MHAFHGVLKHRPADFLVREVMVPRLVDAPTAAYRLLLLRKCGYTTFEAIRHTAVIFSLASTEVTYGGLKDEDGITEQLIAIPATAVLDEVPVRMETEPGRWIEWTHHGYSAEPLQIGRLTGNAFRIVLRGLDSGYAHAVAGRRRIVGHSLNYYGPQRFGVPGGPRRTHLVGRALFDGEWAEALRVLAELRSPESLEAREWTDTAESYFRTADPRRVSFYLAAHASHRWNEQLRQLAEDALGDDCETAEQDGIGYLIPTNSNAAIRLLARATTLPYTRYTFTPDGIASTDSERTTVLQTSVTVVDVDDDDAHPGRARLTFEFFLPSGAYATSAVRQWTADRDLYASTSAQWCAREGQSRSPGDAW